MADEEAQTEVSDLKSAGFVVYVGMGSNLGDRVKHIQDACEQLITVCGIEQLSCSPFYETTPMGPAAQPDYVNAVCRFSTVLEAHALLDELQAIEAMHGRERTAERWGARPLDLDLLLYADSRIATPRLQVPHPGMPKRSFVLQPLFDLTPDLPIPGFGELADLLVEAEKFGIRRLP